MSEFYKRDQLTGEVKAFEHPSGLRIGSTIMSLRVRPGLRAFVSMQAKFEKIRPYQLIRRAIRSYLKCMMMRDNAFFDFHGFDWNDCEFGDDLRREIRLCEIENSLLLGGLTLDEMEKLKKGCELLTIEIQRSVNPDYRKLASRMRERFLYQLGGRRAVLDANGRDHRSLAYMLRAMGEGVFPWHADFESAEDFLNREIAAGPEFLGYPDERYAADDALCGVHYEPSGVVWAERPGATSGDITAYTKEEYLQAFGSNSVHGADIEADVNYDPSGAISRG